VVDAATIRVRCEQRPGRAKISVDGNELRPGRYRARVQSGTRTRTSTLQATVGDEIEFDFDSASDDIAEGAIPIAANFIQGGQVTGKILNEAGRTVISDTENCRRRN
jgi:hypothetical protein